MGKKDIALSVILNSSLVFCIFPFEALKMYYLKFTYSKLSTFKNHECTFQNIIQQQRDQPAGNGQVSAISLAQKAGSL